MYIVKIEITIQQIPTKDYPNRNRLLKLPYQVSFNGESTWQTLTDTFTITIPKKTYLKDAKDGTIVRLYNQDGLNSNLGGYVGQIIPQQPPAILRGDVVTINAGYDVYLNGKNGEKVTYITGQHDPTDSALVTLLPPLFEGYVSNVDPHMPFTITCENAMWLMKQVPTPNSQTRWTNKNIQEIVQEILNESLSLPNISKYNKRFTVSQYSLTNLIFNVGNFMTRGESLAMVLARVKRQYKLDSWFRGNELRIGLQHYIPDDYKQHTFTFQKNVKQDKLYYQRKDDINLSAVVRSHYALETGKTTKDGQKVSKAESTEILIYRDPQTYEFVYETKEKGKSYFKNMQDDVSGKRLDFEIFDLIRDPEQLFQIGLARLKRYYYDGLRGTFTTFGIPYVKHGDGVKLVDNVLPERNGIYMVKTVKYSFSIENGLEQEIELDYRTDASQ